MTTRRGFLSFLGGAIAAPAIIKTTGLLMPVKPVLEIGRPININYIEPIEPLEWKPIWLHKSQELTSYRETDCADDFLHKFDEKGLKINRFRPMVIEPSHEVRSPREALLHKKRYADRYGLNYLEL